MVGHGLHRVDERVKAGRSSPATTSRTSRLTWASTTCACPRRSAAQADLARPTASGFCYYHYWFAGRRLLERPFDEVLAPAGRIPFCLCWANENWTRRWDGRSASILLQQSYSEDDDRRHIQWLARAFGTTLRPGRRQAPVPGLPGRRPRRRPAHHPHLAGRGAEGGRGRDLPLSGGEPRRASDPTRPPWAWTRPPSSPPTGPCSAPGGADSPARRPIGRTWSTTPGWRTSPTTTTPSPGACWPSLARVPALSLRDADVGQLRSTSPGRGGAEGLHARRLRPLA